MTDSPHEPDCSHAHCPQFSDLDHDELTGLLLSSEVTRGYVCDSSASAAYGLTGIHVVLMFRMHGSKAHPPSQPPFTDAYSLSEPGDVVALVVPLAEAEWLGSAILGLAKEARATANGN